MAEGTRASAWGAHGLPDGQPKTTYYDPFGRSRVLPADPYSLDHYLSQGLSLKPPESPIPIERLGEFARRDENREAPISATRQVAPSEAPEQPEQTDIQMLLARIAKLEAERKPDRKKRKKRKRNRA